MTDTAVTTFALMRLCVAILTTNSGTAEAPIYPTDAGSRIYTPGDWPGAAPQVPYIRARVQAEDKQSLGRSAPRFTVTGAIRFCVYMAQDAQPDDSSAALVDAQLQAIARQIERAVINHPALMGQGGAVQQFPFAHTRDVYDASGAQQAGALEYLLGVEFYQGTEDFFEIPTVALERITLDADLINIFDPTGTYSDPPFPDSVEPAPRTQGSDGRAEGALDITLPQ